MQLRPTEVRHILNLLFFLFFARRCTNFPEKKFVDSNQNNSDPCLYFHFFYRDKTMNRTSLFFCTRKVSEILMHFDSCYNRQTVVLILDSVLCA